MLGYNEQIQAFEFIGKDFNISCFSFGAIKKELKENGINIYTYLN